MARLNIKELKSQITTETTSTDNIDNKIPQNEELSNLMVTIKSLYDTKVLKDNYTQDYKSKQALVIEQMKPLGLKDLKVDGIKCTLTQKVNRSCNEDALLEYCKKLNIPGLIKTVEVIDLDVLRDLTYRKEIDPDEVEQFYTKSITESIRLSGKPKEMM